MQDAGYAALQIIPTFKGFEGNLSKGTAPILDRTGSKSGAIFGDSAGKSMSSRFVSHAKRAALLAGGVLTGAVAVGIKIGKDSLAEAREAQRVGAITANVIKSTGHAANVSAGQVGKLSTAISNRVGIDDEAIQSGANLILTFKQIQNQAGKGNKIFDEATKVTTDMAVAMAGGSGGEPDLKSSAILVGKALNDPAKGLTALTRVGVTFDGQQQKQIKSLVAQGKTMQAQKIILKELQSEFGGTAEAQATMGDKVKVAWGNIEENIGTALLPLVDDLEHAFLKKGVPALNKFSNWFEKDGVKGIQDFIHDAEPLANSILPAAKNGLKDVAGFLRDAAPKAKAVIDAFNNLPSWAQKAVVLGTAGGILAKKTGALSIGSKLLTGGSGSTGGGLLGLVSKTKPLPVFVVNEGFGGGPGGGTGGRIGGILSKGALASMIPEIVTLAVPASISAYVLAHPEPITGRNPHGVAVINQLANRPGYQMPMGTGITIPTGHPDFFKVLSRDANTAQRAIAGVTQPLGKASAAIDLVSRGGSAAFRGLGSDTDAFGNKIKGATTRADILDRRLRGLPRSVRTELSLDDREARRRLAAFRAEAQKSLDLEIAGPHMGRPGDRQSALDGVRR